MSTRISPALLTDDSEAVDIVAVLLERILEDDASHHTIDLGHYLGSDAEPKRLSLTADDRSDGAVMVTLWHEAEQPIEVGEFVLQVQRPGQVR